MPASDVYALGLIGLHLVFACKDANACRQSFIRGGAGGVSMVADKRLTDGSEWMVRSSTHTKAPAHAAQPSAAATLMRRLMK